MARSLEQISRDLESLAAATASIDQNLKELYKPYLGILSKAVKQQLALAVYHLCTQVYPESFLKLSVSQREKIQSGLRKIADQGKTQINQLAEVVAMEPMTSSVDEEVDADTVQQNLSEATYAGVQDIATLDQDDNSDALSQAQSEETSEIAQRLSNALSLFAAFGAEPLSPISLAKRHVLLERQLRAILQTISSLTNYLLKQTYVLPDLPEMVIAAAAEAEVGEPSSSTPNLLNVLVEVGNERGDSSDTAQDSQPSDDKNALDDEDAEAHMTHLVAINLRLADIEFADAHTALWRSKIQEVLARLKRLGSQYQKLQREKARAEAEHAWRATWTED